MKPLSKEEFGQRLRALRKKAKLDQAELASEIGVKQGTVSRWEKGLAEAEQDHVESLCRFFGVKEDYFSVSVAPSPTALRAGSDQDDLRELLAILATLDDDEIRSVLRDLRAARGHLTPQSVPASAKRSPKG